MMYLLRVKSDSKIYKEETRLVNNLIKLVRRVNGGFHGSITWVGVAQLQVLQGDC